MRILKVISSILLFLGCVCLVRQTSANAQSSAGFHQIRAVDTSPYPRESASVQAFDISPDGSLVAVLIQSTSPHDNWLRAVIENVATGRARVDIKLNAAGVRPDFQEFPWYEPHIEFSSDQRFLIVQDWQMIQILNISESRIVRTFTSTNDQLSLPLAIHSATSNDMVLVSYGTKVPLAWSNKGFNDLVNPRRVHNELIDISTGQRQSSWDSSDIPQSLSPDGKLAAVSEWEGTTPLVEIEIVDAQTGQKLKALDSGFKFKKPWAPGPAGRVVGKFLSNDEILLSPDEHFDRTGHRSGESLRILRVSDGKLIREIRPEHFGPIGEVAVSAARDCFAVVSWHISPGAAKRDAAPTESPSLIVFPDPTKVQSFTISQLEARSGLDTNQWLDTWRPRISNKASTVAIAGDRDVIVFQRN